MKNQNKSLADEVNEYYIAKESKWKRILHAVTALLLLVLESRSIQIGILCAIIVTRPFSLIALVCYFSLIAKNSGLIIEAYRRAREFRYGNSCNGPAKEGEKQDWREKLYDLIVTGQFERDLYVRIFGITRDEATQILDVLEGEEIVIRGEKNKRILNNEVGEDEIFSLLERNKSLNAFTSFRVVRALPRENSFTIHGIGQAAGQSPRKQLAN